MNLGVVAALCLFFSIAAAPPAFPEDFQEITVKEGDTLWGIANHYLKDPNRWPDILKHNNLPLNDPTVALPGTKLRVPVLLVKEHLRKATLTTLIRDVHYRKKDEALWSKAAQGMNLYNEDGLRTQEKSFAQIKFYSGDFLKVDENSLVILRPELKREEVNLLAGAVLASRSKVITPTVQVTPQSTGTFYKARLRNDKATIVHVEKGSAEVLGLDTGEKVIVQAGFANITLPEQAPTVPVKVPQMSGFKFPDFSPEGVLIFISDAPSMDRNLSSSKLEIEPPAAEDVQLNKMDSRDLENQNKESGDREIKKWRSYRIVVAKDPKFSQIVWDQKKEVGEEKIVTHAKDYALPDGKYYRGISYFDAAGAESGIRPLGPFEIDTQPPKIVLFSPPEGYRSKESLVNIEGQTEPNSFITINNYPVPIKSDGKFFWSVVLANEGPNKIKIVVRDRLKNRSELERVIYFLSDSKR